MKRQDIHDDVCERTEELKNLGKTGGIILVLNWEYYYKGFVARLQGPPPRGTHEKDCARSLGGQGVCQVGSKGPSKT